MRHGSGMANRYPGLVGALACLSIVGCTHQHAPDPALVAELDDATQVTVLAMALPATERPSRQEISARMDMVAVHISPGQEVAVRSGRLDQVALRAEYRSVLQRSSRKADAAPPTLLVFLDRSATHWSMGQCLLFDGLLQQFEQEAGLAAPATEMATGGQ